MSRRNELIPGGSEAILKWLERQGSSIVGPLERIDRYLATHGANLLDPRHEAAKELAVERTVNRLVAGNYIRKEAAPALIKDWAVDFSYGDQLRVGSKVAAKLETRDLRDALVDAGPLPAAELRVYEVLEQIRGQLAPGVSIDKVARDFVDIGQGRTAGPELARAVVNRLNVRPELVAGGKLELDPRHPVFQPPPRPEGENRPGQAYGGF
jgi:hypothetical protein